MRRAGRILALVLALAPLGSSCVRKNTLQALTQEQVAPPPQTTAIQMSGYVPAAGRTLKDFFVSNFSVKAGKGTLQLMTARDGLPDALKQAHAADYGFSTAGPYSANPYFSDLFLYLAGIVSAQQGLLGCGSGLQQSSSNDAFVYIDSRTGTEQFLGLRDCEKQYLGLDPASFDNDGDGIPDYLELRCGLNPKNANDASLDITGDGLSNLEKCKRNIPVDESASTQPNKLFAYQYVEALQTDGTRDLTVSNIPILNDGQDNFIAFYLTETDTTTLSTRLYTAYMILKGGSTGKTIHFPYWGTNPSNEFDQELIPQ